MKRKSNAVSQAIVGVFMITVLLLLGYFTIVISGIDVLAGRDRRPIRIAFAHVGGLKDHDNVMFRGTKVGAVERVEVTPTNLVVVAMIDGGVTLRKGYCARVCNLSMLGGNFLQLEEGEGEALDLASTLFRGDPPSDWMQDISAIARNVKAVTEMREIRSIVTNVEAAAAKARAFSEKADEVSAKAEAIADKVAVFMDQAKEVMARIERGEGTVGKLLSSDDTVYADLKETLANAREVSARLNAEKLFDDLKAGVAAFRKAAENTDPSETIARANELLGNLNDVAAKLKSGEGTLGRLANDSKLYDEVDALVKDVRQVLDNYRDTTPIATFSSLAAGAL